jgi:hypothetical protein
LIKHEAQLAKAQKSHHLSFLMEVKDAQQVLHIN